VRTVTAICLAGVAGTTLAFALLGLFVAGAGLAVPVAALAFTALLLFGALSMARQAGTPGCLPLAVFLLVGVPFFLLLWSSWS
jgi:hypothetical protein